MEIGVTNEDFKTKSVLKIFLSYRSSVIRNGTPLVRRVTPTQQCYNHVVSDSGCPNTPVQLKSGDHEISVEVSITECFLTDTTKIDKV